MSDALNYFTTNIDKWGAAEHFAALVNAVRQHDKAVVAKEDIQAETWRNIFTCEALSLARNYATEIQSAIDTDAKALGLPAEAREALDKAHAIGFRDGVKHMQDTHTEALRLLKEARETLFQVDDAINPWMEEDRRSHIIRTLHAREQAKQTLQKIDAYLKGESHE